MTPRNFALGWLLLFLVIRIASAQPAIFSTDPFLQLQAGGPTAAVAALAFGPGGATLYSAGYDKVVHSWHRKGDEFVPGPSYRVPIGPGSEGILNALALSPDGRWLAAAGLGLVREAAGFRQGGILMPRQGRLRREMLEDQGTIYLFDTTGRVPVRALRGHRGPVLSMIFAPGRPGKSGLLVSASWEGTARPPAGQLRLWDPETARLVRPSKPFAKPDGRPIHLAAWRTGTAEGDVAVAVGIDDQALRVWDAARGELRELGKAPVPVPRPLAFLPEKPDESRGSLYVGFAERGGRLEGWRVAGDAAIRRDVQAPQLVHPSGEGACLALAAIPAGPGKTPALAAVVSFRPASPLAKQYRLLVFKHGPRGLTAARPDGVPLWVPNGQPALAASRDGRYLAVASSPAREVLVYPVAELLEGRIPAPKRLRSDGLLIDRVEFVVLGKERGLRLRERLPDGTTQQLVLEFGGDLTADGRGVRDEPPGGSDWTVEGDVGTLTLKGPRWSGKSIDLGPHRRRTAHAILPRGARQLPLVAIAFVEGGVNHLGLFDPEPERKGELIRQYSGHVDRIRSLAFDGSGKLLASASDDKTVCLWSLADLGEHLGRHGRVNGLSVGDGLVIVGLNDQQLSQTNRKALSAKQVAVGDVIEGIVRGGKPARPSSPHEFYEALFHREPGATVTLRIVGKGDVKLRLDQGIDDRKPLLTFFLRRGQWLAWSPHGYYDASDPGALERRISWQSNPADPTGPVQVSSAAKYRREYHRKGIVPKLVKHGSLEPAVKELLREPAPAPGMSLQIDGVDLNQRDRNNNVVVQQVPRTLRARVSGIDPWRVESVRWRLLGEAALRPFDTVGDQEYTSDLSRLKWRRGEYRFQLVVTTGDSVEHRSEPLAISFQHPKPTVAFSRDWLQKQFGEVGLGAKRVKDEELLVKAEARPTPVPGVETPRVKLQLLHNGRQIPPSALRGADPVVGEWKLQLDKRANTIVVTAENENADPDSPFERSSASLDIDFVPDPPPVPRIVLESVRTERGQLVSLVPRPKDAVLLTARRADLRGRVLVGGKLEVARLDGRPLRGFDPKAEVDPKTKLLAVPIEDPVELPPGKPTRVTVTAKAPRGDPVEESVTLLFRPEVPRLHPSQPRRWSLKPHEPTDVTLRLRLSPAAYPEYDYRATLTVNKRPAAAAVRKEDEQITAAAKLQPGPNSIHLRIENEYGDRYEEELTAFVPRPPTILAPLSLEVDRDRPLATLKARVESPGRLPLVNAWVFLNGVRLRATRPNLVRVGKDPRLWEVVLADLPLREGANEVRLWVKNEEGESLPQSITRPYRAVRPPRIVRVNPLDSREVSRPEFPLEFRIRSERPVEAGLRVNDAELPLPPPQREEGGVLYRVPLKNLRVGANDVEITCPPADPQRLTINYVPMWTAKVRFLGWRRADGRAALHPLTEPAPVGHVLVEGEVEYRDAAELSKSAGVRVRSFVNDFEQLDALLDPPKGLRREFRLPVRLNRVENRVEAVLPASHKLDTEGLPTVKLRCQRPEKEQKLHLVVLGPDQANQKAFVARVLDAFQQTWRSPDGQKFRTKVFQDGELYAFPAGVGRGAVLDTLREIRGKLQTADSPVNDVVVVYFSGQEKYDPRGAHYLMTRDALLGDLREAIRVDELREHLDQTRGAKLLLLDSHLPRESESGTRGLAERPEERLGVYRYEWLGPAPPAEKERLVTGLSEAMRRKPLVRDHREFLRGWTEKLGKSARFRLVAPEGLLGLELSRP